VLSPFRVFVIGFNSGAILYMKNLAAKSLFGFGSQNDDKINLDMVEFACVGWSFQNRTKGSIHHGAKIFGQILFLFLVLLFWYRSVRRALIP
jgi:hypothetical protein